MRNYEERITAKVAQGSLWAILNNKIHKGISLKYM